MSETTVTSKPKAKSKPQTALGTNMSDKQACLIAATILISQTPVITNEGKINDVIDQNLINEIAKTLQESYFDT